jgi:hypothetical protein
VHYTQLLLLAGASLDGAFAVESTSGHPPTTIADKAPPLRPHAQTAQCHTPCGCGVGGCCAAHCVALHPAGGASGCLDPVRATSCFRHHSTHLTTTADKPPFPSIIAHMPNAKADSYPSLTPLNQSKQVPPPHPSNQNHPSNQKVGWVWCALCLWRWIAVVLYTNS